MYHSLAYYTFLIGPKNIERKETLMKMTRILNEHNRLSTPVLFGGLKLCQRQGFLPWKTFSLCHPFQSLSSETLQTVEEEEKAISRPTAKARVPI